MSTRKALWLMVLFATLMLEIAVDIPVSARPQGTTPPKWSHDLPADACPWGDTNCHYGAPVLAHIDGDAFLDIVAVTNNGYVVAYNHNGVRLWREDIAPAFGMAAGTHEIHSSPAVADIDNDGHPEIVVGAGTLSRTTCTQGGLIVLDHNGHVENGWPYLAYDAKVPPPGCRDTIYATPALADLDNDGDLEIVANGFDKRVYAWHHDGSLVSGYPPDSYLTNRFPLWPNLYDQLLDLTWASPAVADLDGNGYLDVILGSGEGNFEASWGGDAQGWTCPFTTVGWFEGYCGGSFYAWDGSGNRMPGFPVYIFEAIGSTSALADVNRDGLPEIFSGTSLFFHQASPDHPTVGFRLYGYDRQGNELPGWGGGRPTGHGTVMSPAIGDITGDGQLDIVTAAADKKLYAWHHNGTVVSGFPMKPLDGWGNSDGAFDVHRGITLADYDGDGVMEILLAQGPFVTVIDGNGQLLTGTNLPYNVKPVYYAEGLLLNTPALGDVDNDGKLELIASNSRLFVWDLPDASNEADWPMFKQNAARTSLLEQPTLVVKPSNIGRLHEIGDHSHVTVDLQIMNTGPDTINWAATEPGPISVVPDSGSVASSTSATATIPWNSLSPGLNSWTITVTGTVSGQTAAGSPRSIPVSVWLVNQVHTSYLPLAQK